MKKTLSLILAVLFVVTSVLMLSSCGKKEDNGPAVNDDELLVNAPNNYTVALNVSINPSLTLYLDEGGEVIACEMLNSDAEKMIDKRLIEGRLLKDAMRDIIISAIENEFLKNGGEITLYVICSFLSQFDTDNMVNDAEDVAREEAKSRGVMMQIFRTQSDNAIVSPDATSEPTAENPTGEEPASDETPAENTSQKQPSGGQNGSGSQSDSDKQDGSKKVEGCSVCGGSGICGYCKGKGIITCEECHGKGYFPCSQCGGEGKMRCSCGDGLCSLCHGEGYITCETCGGSDPNCEACKGTGKQRCYRCPDLPGKCSQCKGTVYTGTCDKCNGTGKDICNSCKGTKITDCNQCHGSGKCPGCNGTGRKPD